MSHPEDDDELDDLDAAIEARIDRRVRQAALLYLDGRCAAAEAELRAYIAARADEMPPDVRCDLEAIATLFGEAERRGKAWASQRAAELQELMRSELPEDAARAAERAADRTVDDYESGLIAPRKDRPS